MDPPHGWSSPRLFRFGRLESAPRGAACQGVLAVRQKPLRTARLRRLLPPVDRPSSDGFACHLPNEAFATPPRPASVLARGRSVHVTQTPFDQRRSAVAVPLDRHDRRLLVSICVLEDVKPRLAGICSRPTGTGASLTGDARGRLTNLAANVLLRKPSETLFGTFPGPTANERPQTRMDRPSPLVARHSTQTSSPVGGLDVEVTLRSLPHRSLMRGRDGSTSGRSCSGIGAVWPHARSHCRSGTSAVSAPCRWDIRIVGRG